MVALREECDIVTPFFLPSAHRLSVRTSGFHPGKPGSTPGGRASAFLLPTSRKEDSPLIEEIWEIRKGLPVAPCKGKKCCGICILGVPKTKNSATVFQSREVHDGERNAPWRRLSLRLLFRNIVAEFLCGVPAAYKCRNIPVLRSAGGSLWIILLRVLCELLFKTPLPDQCRLLTASRLPRPSGAETIAGIAPITLTFQPRLRNAPG